MANILDKYRRTHKRIQAILKPYTKELCPVCQDLCCKKPVKVKEFDVIIANACGYSFQSTEKAVAELIEDGISRLKGNEAKSFELCDYLGENGCTFPDDLRPYECARFICKSLKAKITPSDMRKLRDQLHKLNSIHSELKDSVIPKIR
jgi:hypothetical protein